MNRLLIKQVKYIGATYIYESPILKSGLNILVGENGSGKTTFSSLIYFGFGGTVRWFRNEGKEDHKQIVEDNSNYVEITFLINDVEYVLTRYFYAQEINIISERDVQSLPLKRSVNNKFTFSDWLLERLNIDVVEIYQGSEDHKINFLDLFRLFYYDQNTATDKIYKNPDIENWLTDSILMRKAIFEILMGNTFNGYYRSVTNYRKALEEYSVIKSLIQNFESLNDDSLYLHEGKNSYNLELELNELASQLRKLEEYRETINDNVTSIKSATEILSAKRKTFSELEGKIMTLKRERDGLVYDYTRVKRLRDNLILEVTHLKKIIITNEKLNLFSPNTCPYCLKQAARQENKCICGNDVADNEYQKFFYSKQDYLNILKSKQKNIDTVEAALDGYNDEIADIATLIALSDKRLEDQRVEINNLNKGRRIVKNIELKEVNDKILDIEKRIAALRQQIRFEQKREELEQQRNSSSLKVDSLKRDMELKRLESSREMDEVLSEFNKKYYSLMKKALDDCKSARISNDDYMPIINSGAYKEASSNVSKRLMYFFTLLFMSIKFDTNFPRFLLIDTPENIGIDNDNLIKALSLINEIGYEDDYQIILTTGFGKYPKQFESRVFSKITKRDKLLIKRTINSHT